MTTGFKTIAVQKRMTGVSFLTKQNILFMILQHISQSTSAVNGSCQFKQQKTIALTRCKMLNTTTPDNVYHDRLPHDFPQLF